MDGSRFGDIVETDTHPDLKKRKGPSPPQEQAPKYQLE